MRIESRFVPLGYVPFPSFVGERVYMVAFNQRDGLPTTLARWRPTVAAMLRGVTAPGLIYIMIDESIVEPGKPQRRGGPHIDGNWIAAKGKHGGHTTTGSHRAASGGWDTSGHGTKGLRPEAIILASSAYGCDGFFGTTFGEIGEGGDCSRVDLTRLERRKLTPRIAYAGNVTFIHESVPVEGANRRQLVRLNVPGWEPALK